MVLLNTAPDDTAGISPGSRRNRTTFIPANRPFADRPLHAHHYGRIEMVIFENPKDETGKRIDLTNGTLRKRVAQLTTISQLKSLFEEV